MLKVLQSMIKESLLIVTNPLTIDFDTLPEKNTFLFVSREFADTMTKKPKQMEGMFILENNTKEADHQKRFGSGLDLIFQLADEIYQCYMEEAREHFESGDVTTANIKQECANQIQGELKRIYNSICKDSHVMVKPMDTTTAIIWLNINRQRIIEIEGLSKLLSTIVSSFSVFDDQVICEQYLLENKSVGMIFFVISTDHQISVRIEPHQLSNVKIVYYCEKASSKNEPMITKYNDLCFRLISDLATHYNNLGSIYSAKQDAKTAKDMFIKTYELYNILAKL